MSFFISTLLSIALAQALPYAPPQLPQGPQRAARAMRAAPKSTAVDMPPGNDAPSSDEPGEPVVGVRPSSAPRPSLWARTKSAVGDAVSRLWEKDEPHATQGNLDSLNGNVDEALKQYDESEKHLPQNGDAAATLAFDRSTAMLKGPPEQAAKALEQAQAARESGDAELRAKAAYNAGVALEQQGKPDEAIKAYANALSMNPDDVDSKVNLELLLQEHDKKQPQQGQQDKDKKQQPQKDKDQDQQQQSKGDKDKDQKKDDQKEQQQQGDQKKDEQAQQKKDEQQKDAKQDEKKDEKGQAGEQPDEKKDGEKPQDQQQKQASMGRSEAQRLLDAARAGEKNLQMWRFGKKTDQHKQRTASEKDW